MSATYDPTLFFLPRNMDQAKGIVLTAEDTSTERRWQVETPYLTDLMLQNIPLGPLNRVLDFGCGPGRLSKALIDNAGCRVFGVDISPAMRALAMAYVESPYFIACDPEMMICLPGVDAVLAVWSIQHAADPEKEIIRLSSMLKPRGRMFVVSSEKQILPVANCSWFINDDVDMLPIFLKHMRNVKVSKLDPDKTSPLIAAHSWWGVFEPL